MLDRNIPPPIYSPTEFDFKLQSLSTHLLDNGIPLYYISDDIEPVIQLELVFEAGLWYESQKGIAQATAALIKSGTSTKTAFEINQCVEQYGASLKAAAGSDRASIQISCLTKHLAHILPLVAEIIQDTQFPQSELDIYIQNAKQRLSVQLRKGDFIANRKIDEYLFGFQHPYGRYMLSDDYDSITVQQLKQHLHHYYTSKTCQLFLAGSFDQSAIELINHYLGNITWNSQLLQEEKHHNTEATPEKKFRIINDEKSVQGAIRLASHFPEKHHPDFPYMIMLNTVFGGYFGSRLMSNIREDKGYTYGIHSYMYNHRYLGAYLISTEAGRDVCEATLEEVYNEMKRLREEPIPNEELQLVKNYLLGNILGDLDGSFQIIQRWKNLLLNGFGEERFYSNIETYKQVESEKLMEMANTYLHPELFYELIVY